MIDVPLGALPFLTRALRKTKRTVLAPDPKNSYPQPVTLPLATIEEFPLVSVEQLAPELWQFGFGGSEAEPVLLIDVGRDGGIELHRIIIDRREPPKP